VASAEPAADEVTERLSILGVPLDPVGPDEARERLRSFLADPWDGRCRHVVTLNPEYVMAASRDPVFARAIAGGDLVTADGIGVAVAAKLLGPDGDRVRRVTGGDLVHWLAAESASSAAPLYLLGGGPGVAAEAARQLQARYPDARIAGWWSDGSPSPEDDARTLNLIRGSGARAVAVAYGAPGQVIWIERNRLALGEAGVRVALGIGGVLDFLAGTKPRAPRLVQRAGLEWSYRLIREPWRWRRQVVLPVFGLRVLIEKLWRRGNRPGRIARPK
jgi:N-acetylglucosaminyldiphosphoundecaprenol N-acetyl-beta-D-mannosaminyltransferase